MRQQRISTSGYAHSSRGFSMVELMVAIVIGLILLAGISGVMVSSKRTYTTQDSLGRLQENARIAMMILTRELRNAGYVGCNINPDNIRNNLNGGSTFDFNLTTLLEGSEKGGAWQPTGTTMAATLGAAGITPRANTDLFMVRGLVADGSMNITGKMNSERANIHLTDTSTINAGDIMVLSDCSSTDIFQVTGTDPGTSGGQPYVTHTTATSVSPGNNAVGGDKLSKAYGPDAQLMRFNSAIFYIAPGASGEPSLWKYSIGSLGNYYPVELVEGIENLQVSYGVDTSSPADQVADTYVDADTVNSVGDWTKVVSVRFGIISRALANLQNKDRKTANTAEDVKQLDIDGDGTIDFVGTETGVTTNTDTGATTKDRLYDRRMFRTTVLLRNLVNKEAS